MAEVSSIQTVQERTVRPTSGWSALVGIIGLFVAAPVLIIYGAIYPVAPLSIALGALLLPVAIVLAVGFQAVAPNDARVFLLFGEYRGSVRETGFYWVNPFFTKKKISLRVRNFETGSTVTPATRNDMGKVVQKETRSPGKPSKVNDRDGNPIEISAVVVWKVVDTAEAMFEVDDYEDFVAVQSEAALRSLASRHPYDSEDHVVSLRGNTIEVCDQLQSDIQERLEKAGVHVVEARISHLAYASEIAAAMLQRQQAQAIVAARMKIVEGAVGMVQLALNQLAEEKVIELDEERRAAMVSNLLVVLCGSSHAQPVMNTGTLYN